MKKSMILIFTLIFIIAMSTIAFAADNKIEIKLKDGVKAEEVKVDLSKYEIIKPTKDVVSVSNKSFMVNGKAIPGSDIVIGAYSAPDLRKKDYNLEKLPADDEYILLSEATVKAGNLGLFQKQIDLVSGVNKLVITFKDSNVKPIVVIVYVYENLELNKDNSDVLPLLR